jgi:hypothetical protein
MRMTAVDSSPRKSASRRVWRHEATCSGEDAFIAEASGEEFGTGVWRAGVEEAAISCIRRSTSAKGMARE